MHLSNSATLYSWKCDCMHWYRHCLYLKTNFKVLSLPSLDTVSDVRGVRVNWIWSFLRMDTTTTHHFNVLTCASRMKNEGTLLIQRLSWIDDSLFCLIVHAPDRPGLLYPGHKRSCTHHPILLSRYHTKSIYHLRCIKAPLNKLIILPIDLRN